MEDSDVLRLVTGIMYDSPVEDAGEIMQEIPSIPSCFSRSEFAEQLRFVYSIKKRIVAFRWRKFFDTCHKTMLSTREMYLTCVMSACIREQNCHQIIFDRFMSVCAVVKILCDETLQKTGVDLSVFNTDIIRTIYLASLTCYVTRRGGMNGFVDYIRNHRYLEWKSNGSFLPPDDPAALFKGMNLDELIEKELRKGNVVEMEINVDEIANDADSIKYANYLLSCKSNKFPSLPSYEDLIAYKQKGKAKKAIKTRTEATENFKDSNVDTQASLCSEFKINDVHKNQENAEWYDKIIQAVIMHNHSKSSIHDNPNNKIQEEANGVLQHLKETIENLTQVLKEFDTD